MFPMRKKRTGKTEKIKHTAAKTSRRVNLSMRSAQFQPLPVKDALVTGDRKGGVHQR